MHELYHADKRCVNSHQLFTHYVSISIQIGKRETEIPEPAGLGNVIT